MNEIQFLYLENFKKIYYYLRNLSNNDKLSEDLSQETFYKALLYLHINGNADITPAWLVKVAHNLYIDYLRRNKANTIELECCQTANIVFAPEVDRKMDIINILKMLPVRYRSLILLRDYFGFSYSEISDMLNCTQTSVKSALRRARNNFREVYQIYGE